jgi:hypothetical protein
MVLLTSRIAPSDQSAKPHDGPLAIICGAGVLPYAIADNILSQGRAVVLFAIRGWADATAVERFNHHWITIGQFGRLRRLLHKEGCRDVVLIGGLVRPSISQIKLDWATIRLLPRLIRAFRGGDDHLLSSLAAIFTESGFYLMGAHEVAPDILMPVGALGHITPNERDKADIARALELLAAMGRFDVGQGAIVADDRVLAVEAAEGTDRMLAHIVNLRREGRIHSPVGVGVLVKAPKSGQDRRFDLPSIGPATIEGVAAAGLAGVACIAGATLLAGSDAIIAAANRANVFVVGIPDPAATVR